MEPFKKAHIESLKIINLRKGFHFELLFALLKRQSIPTFVYFSIFLIDIPCIFTFWWSAVASGLVKIANDKGHPCLVPLCRTKLWSFSFLYNWFLRFIMNSLYPMYKQISKINVFSRPQKKNNELTLANAFSVIYYYTKHTIIAWNGIKLYCKVFLNYLSNDKRY